MFRLFATFVPTQMFRSSHWRGCRRERYSSRQQWRGLALQHFDDKRRSAVDILDGADEQRVSLVDRRVAEWQQTR